MNPEKLGFHGNASHGVQRGVITAARISSGVIVSTSSEKSDALGRSDNAGTFDGGCATTTGHHLA